MEELCSLIGYSTEAGYGICRKLEKSEIIETITDPFSIRIAIVDHRKIEDIPQGQPEENSLARELESFKAKKVDMDEKVASIQAELEQKKQSMFADIDAKFRQEIDKSGQQ